MKSDRVHVDKTNMSTETISKQAADALQLNISCCGIHCREALLPCGDLISLILLSCRGKGKWLTGRLNFPCVPLIFLVALSLYHTSTYH